MAVDASVQVTELTVNDHACLTYGEQAELLELTAAFVRDGLSGRGADRRHAQGRAAMPAGTRAPVLHVRRR